MFSKNRASFLNSISFSLTIEINLYSKFLELYLSISEIDITFLATKEKEIDSQTENGSR